MNKTRPTTTANNNEAQTMTGTITNTPLSRAARSRRDTSRKVGRNAGLMLRHLLAGARHRLGDRGLGGEFAGCGKGAGHVHPRNGTRTGDMRRLSDHDLYPRPQQEPVYV